MTLTELTCPSGYDCTFTVASGNPDWNLLMLTAIFITAFLFCFLSFLCWLKWGDR